jgi:hypothetical protein
MSSRLLVFGAPPEAIIAPPFIVIAGFDPAIQKVLAGRLDCRVTPATTPKGRRAFPLDMGSIARFTTPPLRPSGRLTRL